MGLAGRRQSVRLGCNRGMHNKKMRLYFQAFGSFTTCSNTATAVRAVSKCVSYYDKNEINMYVLTF